MANYTLILIVCSNYGAYLFTQLFYFVLLCTAYCAHLCTISAKQAYEAAAHLHKSTHAPHNYFHFVNR